MTRREQVTCAVYEAVDDLNGQLPRAQRLVKALGTPLFGPGAALDSLGLVNLIAGTQQKIEDTFGARLTLADGELLAGGSQHISTLGGFINYIEATLDKRGHA
jgi:acyl carrier protein